MQNAGFELPRIPVIRRSVNKGRRSTDRGPCYRQSCRARGHNETRPAHTEPERSSLPSRPYRVSILGHARMVFSRSETLALPLQPSPPRLDLSSSSPLNLAVIRDGVDAIALVAVYSYAQKHYPSQSLVLLPLRFLGSPLVEADELSVRFRALSSRYPRGRIQYSGIL